MSTDTMLNKLNRLRVNAGKPELKSWKTSKDKLMDAISSLENQGFQDVFPGANTDAAPVTTDPEILKALAKEEEEKAPPKVTKIKSELARGVPGGNDSTHSRKSLADQREKERKEAKKQKRIKLSKEEQSSIKEEAADRGKAERQKKHIEEKRAKRAAEGKLKPAKEKNSDEITVADIARELGLHPKIARAKLRRHEAKINDLHTKGQDRWAFPKSAKKVLVDILNGKK